MRVQLKCSRTTPACTNCMRARQDCAYKTEDGRKNPSSKHYIASLERQIASLEDVIRRMQPPGSKINKAPIFDALAMRDELQKQSAEFQGDLTHWEQKQLEHLSFEEARIGKLSISASPQGHISYQGPTSIYRLGGMHGQIRQPSPPRQATASSLYCTISAEEPAVDEILRSFFRWQYHEYMFIYREAFLLDYLNHEYQGRYCSLTLVYAICALGCVAARAKNTTMAMMTHFMEKAYSGLPSLETLHIDATAIQALLSLAFCELALGNISKVWLLSG